MKPFQVVGNYIPKKHNEANIRAAINRAVNQVPCKLHKGFIEVRKPSYHSDRWTGNIKRVPFFWHRDLVRAPEWRKVLKNKRIYILVWSNKEVTEFRKIGSKKIIRVNKGDIVVFDNSEYQHRTPPVKPYKRWFARHYWGLPGYQR
jgi:hypothetical protein